MIIRKHYRRNTLMIFNDRFYQPFLHVIAFWERQHVVLASTCHACAFPMSILYFCGKRNDMIAPIERIVGVCVEIEKAIVAAATPITA
jgi:hypothetical protein